MKLHVLGSSSAGNGYVLESKDSMFLLECGVPFETMMRAIDFEIEKIVGGVVSHSHGDHAKHIKKYLNRGVTILNNVFPHHNSLDITHKQKTTIGEWTIIPLKMVHDVECFGFIINHKECGNILFVTDTSKIPYRLSGLSHMIIETNYSQDYLDQRQLDHKINNFLANRVEDSHLSFEDASEWILANKGDGLETITLIHLSDSNSEGFKFVKELESKSGVPVNIAEAGESYQLVI